ncbi:Phosphate ABC transporter substrate-binding protein [Hyella patelloides LEGE 07179]|uniref:Phosphate ABC transporter substrate-binding protein n=1 Tax=Hyella patelloides LEGE 07179 TaxID=945734 RepID=A0A563VIP8_9CYAN|nr:substrate-binding domain-containing protein [Hyella patelloides]VEP11304.1 Phosphate ABC transporter substrate-binding protein [Hyella patelloides LEGE 07179]
MQIIKLKFRQIPNQGFFATLSCSKQPWEIEGYLTAIPDALIKSLQQWQITYRQLEAVRSYIGTQTQFRIIPKSVTVASSTKCVDAVKHHLNQWLNNSDREWQPIRDGLISVANQFNHQELPIIIDAQNINLCRLPWQEWDLLTQYYPETEVAINTLTSKDIAITPISNFTKQSKVRILLVVGNSNNIDTKADLQAIQQLTKKKAVITCLIQPSLKDLCTSLWHHPGYHIFIFTGHSGSNDDGTIGWIAINETERLTIAEFKDAFRQAIKNGLRLAIFNSCDGLGLADRLSELNLTQMIVMGEPVPDEVAIEFIKQFFTAFINHKSLFNSVHQARKKLEPFNTRYPGAVWLPRLCLKPTTNYLTWNSILSGDSANNTIKTKQSNKFIQLTKTIVTCLLIFILGFSFNLVLFNGFNTEIANKFNLNHKIQFPNGTWQYGGSTTWQLIRELVNQQLQQKYPHFELVYTRHPTLPNGSETGIKMLLDGQISFAQSSRPIEDREYDSAIVRGKILKQVPVAIDGIAVVVNPQLEIEGLTIQQLEDIYRGKITNWAILGGQDREIIPYTRPRQSGTTEYFYNNILESHSFGKNVTFLEYPTLALKQIEDNLGGMFFVSVSEVIDNCNFKILPIARRMGSNFISLNRDNSYCGLEKERLNIEVLRNGEYPLVRRLFIVIEANSPVDEEVGEAYKDYLLSKPGQELISKSGFIPLRYF